MARLVDVAKLAGTSVSTVNRVLKGLHVKESTRLAVINAKNALKYRMDIPLEEHCSTCIRVEFGSHYRKDTFVLNLLDGIKTGTQTNNCSLTISIKGIDNGFSKLVDHENIDGYLIVGTTIQEEEFFLKQLSRGGKPFLFVNRKFNLEDVHCVSADNLHGAYIAVKHLIQRSRSKIAFIKGDEAYLNSNNRFQGYKKAMTEAGLPVNERFILDGRFDEQTSYLKVRQLLKEKERPDAIFSSSDNMAFGAMRAIREASLKIPEDIAIVGYDNIDLCSYIEPQLTSISVDSFAMGILSVDILMKLLQNKSINEIKVSMKPNLVIRQST